MRHAIAVLDLVIARDRLRRDPQCQATTYVAAARTADLAIEAYRARWAK